jgi:hypothetical protein
LDEALTITDKRPEAHLIRAWLLVIEGKMEPAVVAARHATESVARLREVEGRFIEEVLVQRLMQYEPLANVLAARWEPRPPSQTGRQRTETSASSTVAPLPPKSK